MPVPVKLLAAAGLLAAAVAAVATRDAWLPPPAAETAPEEPHDHHHDDHGVTLSPQAVANLKLVSRPARLGTYWKTIDVPGAVIERPGVTDRTIPAPVAGLVARLHVQPGDPVKPGDRLFTLAVVGESLHTLQADLFRTTQEMAQNRKERDRLATVSTAIPMARLIELDNAHARLAANVRAWRHELALRGLTAGQIDAAADGRFAQEVQVHVPVRAEPAALEVHELKVELGQQVPAGQVLVTLTNPQALLIEGHAFPAEAPLLENAARHGWPVQAEFAGDDPHGWPATTPPLTIRTQSTAVDPATNTFPFTLALTNQSRSYEKDGRTLRAWRYRPGQRVRLRVPVERWDDVLVLPADAVVREGGEAYVFRQNGDRFERTPVQVVYQDRRGVVLKNDGSVPPGVRVAHSAAAALNRALKAQAGGGGHHHDHHH